MFKNVETLKSRSEVTKGRWKWYYTIALFWAVIRKTILNFWVLSLKLKPVPGLWQKDVGENSLHGGGNNELLLKLMKLHNKLDITSKIVTMQIMWRQGRLTVHNTCSCQLPWVYVMFLTISPSSTSDTFYLPHLNCLVTPLQMINFTPSFLDIATCTGELTAMQYLLVLFEAQATHHKPQNVKHLT